VTCRSGFSPTSSVGQASARLLKVPGLTYVTYESMPLRFVSQELRESRRIAMEASCNLGERGDMLFDDYLDRSCSRFGEARQMANKSNPALISLKDL
jgi:hypothetical protein